MIEFTEYQIAQLTNQAECYIHTHPREALDQISGIQLQEAQPDIVVTDGTTLTAANDFVSINPNNGRVTIYLPPATRSKEYHITMTGEGELVIEPDGAETICGEDNVTLHIQWTSLHLKSDNNGNWLIV